MAHPDHADILGGLVPIVIEQVRLAAERRLRYLLASAATSVIIFITGGVDADHMASLICAQLLFLESENPKKDVFAATLTRRAAW